MIGEPPGRAATLAAMQPGDAIARETDDGGPQVREVALGDEPSAAQLLARAFRDNPINCAVIGSDPARRLRSNAAGSRAALESARGRALVLAAEREGALAGALVALPPGAYPLPPPSLRTQLRVLAAQGLGTARRWARVHFELDRAHPREPHWYLAMLGVDPDAQRRGVGGALLRAFLALVDADGAPSYLETDRRENLALYERAAYVVLGEERVLGTAVFRMWRAPGGA